MERTLQDALLRVFGQTAPAETTGTVEPGTGATRGDAALAAQLYNEAVAAQRKGDWATYGEKIAELGKVLERLAAAGKSGN